jgi:uncharacterized membrane protein
MFRLIRVAGRTDRREEERMKSKAAIGNHPLHPALVVIPIGSWFATLVGDIAYANTANLFWYQFSYYTILIGLFGALAAAVLGFIDYFGVRMSEAGYRIARIHMIINLSVAALYAINLWLRHDNGATMASGRWTLVFLLQIVSYLALGASGWLGGTLSYEHKVGVVEHADPEATEIGQSEPAEPSAVPSRTRGLQG